MFNNCRNLTNLNLSNFITSNVLDMKYMFNECINLEELIISNFDTSSVISMRNMFADCKTLRELLNICNICSQIATN